MLESKELFTGTADNYRRFRPTYPAPLVDWVLDDLNLKPGSRIVDVGCGTGITSRLFAAREVGVTGVDPNAEMLEAATLDGGAAYLRGDAEALPLDDDTMDGGIAGQSFHWFDFGVAITELSRVLVPQARCAVFWNLRNDALPFMGEYEALLRSSCNGYKDLAASSATVQGLRKHRQVSGLSEARFEHVQRLDWPGFDGRVRSASYVKHGLRDPATFGRALHDLFARHEHEGHVHMSYVATVLGFRPLAR